MRQKHHAPCKQNLGPNPIWLASPTTQWSSYDLLDVPCHHQGPSQLTRSHGEQLDDLTKALRSCWLIWHGHVEYDDGWLKAVQQPNPTGGRCRGRPKNTWTEVFGMGCLALGLTEKHTSDRKAWRCRFRSVVRLDPTIFEGLIKSSINQIMIMAMLLLMMLMIYFLI